MFKKVAEPGLPPRGSWHCCVYMGKLIVSEAAGADLRVKHATHTVTKQRRSNK